MLTQEFVLMLYNQIISSIKATVNYNGIEIITRKHIGFKAIHSLIIIYISNGRVGRYIYFAREDRKKMSCIS